MHVNQAEVHVSMVLYMQNLQLGTIDILYVGPCGSIRVSCGQERSLAMCTAEYIAL